MARFLCCIDCPDRMVGCHENCIEYQGDKETLRKAKKEYEIKKLFTIIPARDKRIPRK